MNSENRYPVAASLFMLKEMKFRHERVNRGYQLLKRKVEALRYRGRQVASELVSTQGILGHTLKEAYMSLAAVKFTNGESNAMVLENIGEAQVRVLRVPENISGVSTFLLEPIEESGDGAGDALRYAGLGCGGHRTTEAKKSFREVVRLLVKFASLRNTCVLLDDAIKSTLRKVNGIEKVIIPKLINTQNYILMEMDEREREDFHRLKMVKVKKMKRQRLAMLHHEKDTTKVGEGNVPQGLSFVIPDMMDDPAIQDLVPHCRYTTEVLTSIMNTFYPGLPPKATQVAISQSNVCFSNDEDDDLLF